METGSAKTLKVAIKVHEGEHSTKVVWWFNVNSVQQYSRDVVEAEISLFPHIQAKALQLNLFHFDEIAGKV